MVRYCRRQQVSPSTIQESGYMRNSRFLLCSFVLAFAQLAPAAVLPDKPKTDDAPPIIAAGMRAYKDKGPEEAVKAWIKGSAIDGSKEALSQANNLRQIQDFYGAYQGYEVVSTRDISPRVRMIGLVINFEKGPFFGKFIVYQTDQGWILTSFVFNTSSEILP